MKISASSNEFFDKYTVKLFQKVNIPSFDFELVYTLNT